METITLIEAAAGRAHQLNGPLAALVADLDSLAQCKLDFKLRTPASGEYAAVHARLARTMSNLNDVMKQVADIAGSVGQLSGQLAQANGNLTPHTEAQAACVRSAQVRMHELAVGVERDSARIARADALAERAERRARAGRAAVAGLVEVMDVVAGNTREIGVIMDGLAQISFEAEVMSRHATAAARAGDKSREFSVLADGVRLLAQRARVATGDVQTRVMASGDTLAHGRELASAAEHDIDDVATALRESRELLVELAASATAQAAGHRAARDALASLDATTPGDAMTRDIAALLQQSSFLDDAVRVFRLDTEPLGSRRHRQVYALAAGAAHTVQTLLEDAVHKRRLAIDDLFDEDYVRVANTDPAKYRTRFDGLTDELLPAVQERLLDEHDFVIYAGAVDRNGYFPTHNEYFSQPLSGHRERDLAGNRTKRIFNDRVGLSCGRHTDPFKLQAYRRDTGELMFDLSVPIVVCGRHWGGFRIGYRA